MKYLKLFESTSDLYSEVYLLLADFIEEEGCEIIFDDEFFDRKDIVVAGYVPGTNYNVGGKIKRSPANSEEIYDDMVQKLIDNGMFVFGNKFVRNYGFNKYWIHNMYITKYRGNQSKILRMGIDCCLNDLEKYKQR